MSVKLLDVTLSAAQVQGVTISHYYWIDRLGNLTDVGGATLSAAASVPNPTDQAVVDLSQYQAVEMQIQHGALTSLAGGKVSVAELPYDAPAAPMAGAPVVVGTTIDQTLAATAENVRTAIVNPPTAGRVGKAAVAFICTTKPTGGTGLRIVLVGHRDGQEHARG
jgi:hypothetical protein